MSNSLALLLSDSRFPSGEPGHSGGIEQACSSGLISDAITLTAFLRGRLWTAGALGAYAAAGVCTRASRSPVPDSLWRAVEAELDSRIHSPCARAASRYQGGQVLRLAMTIATDPTLDSLARATIGSDQQPHHCVVLGAVAAVGGATPEEAASSAAYASVAGPAFAAQRLLNLTSVAIADIGVEISPEIDLLSSQAVEAADQPFSALPRFAAPALEYLAEEHAERPLRSFAS